MRKMKKPGWLTALLLLVFLVQTEAGAQNWGVVKWVADGDTIVLTDGRHVRYIGIDTPEIDHKNNRAEPMAYEARDLNRKLVEGRRVRLETEEEATDRYGRTLAHVYTKEGLWVNAELVRQGKGHLLYHHANSDQTDALLAVQRKAMGDRRGLWRLISPDERPVKAYQGNRRSKRFHTHNCPNGRRMVDRNRVRLKNQWAAFWEGYAPGSKCIVFPPQE